MKIKKLIFLVGITCFITACNDDNIIETPPEVAVSDLRVDLRPQQTAIRNQGARRSCITFAAVAALEAAYKKIGYGDLDLSEEFLGYMGKNLWLHHLKGDMLWDEVAAKGPGAAENQLGFSGGGNGAGVVLMMDKFGVKVPLEEDMPYLSGSRAYASNPNYLPSTDDTPPKRNPLYKFQYYVDNFNLDTNNLSHRLLHSDSYYGVGSARYHLNATDARNTDLIETILKHKYEVVWDFSGQVDYGKIWKPCSGPPGMNCSGAIAHSMLIVGFDRTDPDPQKHYFMVKNSWGPNNKTSDNQGFTYISYNFVWQYGSMMAYMMAPLLDHGPWEDIKKIGRYQLVFDGNEGMLDIFHIPGFWPEEELGVRDRRLGIFFDGNGTPHRVNGSLHGNKVTFYFSGAHPNLRWDQLEGRRFIYYYSDKGYMAGFHAGADGKRYGGYARKIGALPGGTLTPRPFLPKSYVNSTWDIMLDNRKGTITLDDIEPYESEFPEHYDIYGTYTEDETGATGRVQFRIPQGEFNHFFIQVEAGEEVFSLEGRHLNHKPGNIAGHTLGGSVNEVKYPFIMIRK